MRRFHTRRKKPAVSWVSSNAGYKQRNSAATAIAVNTIGTIPLVSNGIDSAIAATSGQGAYASSLVPQECLIHRVRGQIICFSGDDGAISIVSLGIKVVDIDNSGTPTITAPTWTLTPDEMSESWMWLHTGIAGSGPSGFIGGTGTASFFPMQVDVDVTVKRKLKAQQMLALYVIPNGSTNGCAVRSYLRTLISRVV